MRLPSLPRITFTLCAFGSLWLLLSIQHAAAACAPLPTALGTASFKVQVPQAGTYRFWAHVYPAATNSNGLYVQVDDQYCKIVIGHGGSAPAGQFSWIDYQDGTLAKKSDLTLAAGAHAITIAGLDPEVGIDAVLLTTDPNCIPADTGDQCKTSPGSTPSTTTLNVQPPQLAHFTPPATKGVWHRSLVLLSAGALLVLAAGLLTVWWFRPAWARRLWAYLPASPLARGYPLSRHHHLLMIIAMAGLGLLGCSLLLWQVFALTPTISFNLSRATLGNGAKIVNNAAAIGGKMVQFAKAPTATTNTSSAGTQPGQATQPAAGGSGSSSGGTSGTSGSGGTPSSSSFPDSTNTGYQHAPAYPGHLNNCGSSAQSNTTYQFCDFSNGLYIGSSSSHPTNISFVGCRFASNDIADANVAIYGDNISFDYSTFEPSATSTTPVPYSKGYQYGIDLRYSGKVTINHSNFWGWGNGIQFGFSTQAKPFTVSNSWFHDARNDGGIDHTDAILSNDGGVSYMVFDHNTIVSAGNTNGLALQYAGTAYSNVTVTNNYFSGFGYTVNIGGGGHLNNSVFTDNTFGTDIQPFYGPLYGWGGSGNTWRRNKWHVVSGTSWSAAANDGKYWWPDGTLSSSDYTGS